MRHTDTERQRQTDKQRKWLQTDKQKTESETDRQTEKEREKGGRGRGGRKEQRQGEKINESWKYTDRCFRNYTELQSYSGNGQVVSLEPS